METQPHEARAGAEDHQAHEQQLAAALRDLLSQIDLSDYRDAEGRPIRGSAAFQKAQALVDQFGLTHELLCSTLETGELSGDLAEAARRLAETAKPSATPPEYDTWRTGP